MVPGSESPTNARDAITNTSAAVSDGGYAWDPYVSAWRVRDKLNCPPLVFEPESLDEFDAVVSSIRKYQALYGQLSAGVLNQGRLRGATKICAVSEASIPSERNCISVATKVFLFLRSGALRAHESGAYVYRRGAWTSIGSDLPRDMVDGVLSAFKVADGLYLRGPESWGEFAPFFREWVDGEEDVCPDESEYARHPAKWGVVKAKFLRDMRTKSYLVVFWLYACKSATALRFSGRFSWCFVYMWGANKRD